MQMHLKPSVAHCPHLLGLLPFSLPLSLSVHAINAVVGLKTRLESVFTL